MSHITLLLIPLLFFMTSCTIDWNDEFKEKEKCYSYKERFEKNTGYVAGEIFYSKKLDTCLVKYYYNGVHFIYNILSNKSIKDALDPSQCLSAGTEYQANCKKDFDIFEKEIKELKGE